MGQNFIWITNAFLIAIVIVAIFVLGSGICGGARNATMLIVGWAVQGMGSGEIIMIIASDIIVSDLVPLRQRGNYMAVVLAIYGIGVSLGPFIGGAIVYSTTWRWVFYLNLPIGGTSLVILYLFLHVKYNKDMTFAQKLQRIDIVGNAILMIGTVAILYALSITNPWPSCHKLVPLILGFLAILLFAVYEASGLPTEPVMPSRLFTNRTSVIVSINTFLSSALLFWVMFFLPVYFQAVALDSPRRTGVALLPYSFVGIPSAAISAMALSLWDKFRPLHFAGFALFAIFLGLFSLQWENTSTAEWAIYQCIFALGAGMVLNALLPAFQAPACEADQAAATATWCFIRTFGYVWGVAIPAAIFNSRAAGLSGRISDEGLGEQLVDGSVYQLAAAQYIEKYPLEVQGQIRAVYREALQRVW
ncbi:hypothetical protein BCON_0031g00400 [Botryotinia convoluta]|uniref:Major facilitator superfamily (MFS) profile domain-containing protein n=1 Tax=Botryotinia convoluta TaxID=54673 RepID=A0A4Z1INF6_9HELO|nr:hypothetical protein BCON_0031g00400 [Botryotinia convoluta]